ncbi:MAG: hypothetical protein NEA02_05450 [Thermoanaerobaculia bacterium]|nr:hypothetical protein [Thermoanaerobaculia bacterium]
MRAAARAAALTLTLAIGPGLAGDDALTARLETGGQEWVSRRFPIEIVTNRVPRAEEGRIAVQIGKTDVTDLFEATDAGLRYRPKLRPLPSGEQEIVVFLVTPGQEWKEIAKLPLKVLKPGGLERASVAPKLDVTLKGQLAEGHFPDSAASERRAFQDLTGQATLSADLGRGANGLTAQMALALAARREDALRFGERGQAADRADLASYGLKLALGPGSLEWGGVSFGDNRHLISSFSSRGGKATLALGKVAELSATAVNGTSIVGWDNALGLDTREHQVYAGKLGLELVPSAPGTLRIEGTVVDGSLLPRNGVNRGFVSDAEKSLGFGARALASLFAGRLRLEGGFARSKFTSPSDPLLEQGEKVVPIAPTTRSASYANAALDVVKGTGPFTLGVAFRHERVDPQYRSVAVSTQADLQQDAVEMNAGLGPVTAQFSYGWTEDNLADLVSILKTKTKKTGVTAGVPLGTLLGGKQPGWWLPQLTYGLNETHQFGATRPLGGGFNDTQIPDQLSVNHTGGADWQAGSVRWGWKLNYSMTDNRQVGREKADSLAVAQSANVSVPVTSFLDAAAEYGWERSASKETGAVDRTKRVSMTLGLKPFKNGTLSGNASRTANADDAATRDGLNWAVNVETGWRFEPPRKGTHGLSGQVSLRYGWATSRTRDFVQGIDTFRRTWVVGSGVSLSLF